MTLLTTEIVIGPPAGVVFAADRRISVGGRRASERPKILAVPGKRAAIGYFGLAEVPAGRRRQPMDLWLADYLQSQARSPDLRSLAQALAAELNRVVPAATRATQVSGFHLAGLNRQGEPEFWFIRNIADDRTTVLGQYSAREDFRRRDLPLLPAGAVQVYRNGDIRAHVAAWEAIDQSFGALLKSPNFSPGRGLIAHMRWVQFKLETIAHFYQRFSTTSIIGKPVDALVVTASGITRARTRR